MLCPKCGSQLLGDVQFCAACRSAQLYRSSTDNVFQPKKKASAIELEPLA